MKKGPFGVFFHLRSDSLNMNDTEFTLRDPLLGMKPYFLRFMKYMRMDLSSDELQQVFATLFELVKIKKEELINHDGKIRGR